MVMRFKSRSIGYIEFSLTDEIMQKALQFYGVRLAPQTIEVLKTKPYGTVSGFVRAAVEAAIEAENAQQKAA